MKAEPATSEDEERRVHVQLSCILNVCMLTVGNASDQLAAASVWPVRVDMGGPVV